MAVTPVGPYESSTRVRICQKQPPRQVAGGVLTVLDWKSGKAIYPEAFLQSILFLLLRRRLDRRIGPYRAAGGAKARASGK